VARLLAASLTGMRVRPAFQLASIPPSYHGLPLPLGRFARALRPAGVPVHVWTVDRPDGARTMWAAGVTGIVSNDPAAILEARDGPPTRRASP